jgi:formylmethanofuran dehydrogenase subunit A
VKPPEDLLSSIMPELESKFARYYTIRMENYAIQESYLSQSAPIPTIIESR